jgi:hypothetical protein
MSQSSGAGSSLRSAERFGLDENDRADILVYKYREGLEKSSQEKLCQDLDKGMCSPLSLRLLCKKYRSGLPNVWRIEPRYRCSKIRIPRGNSRVEVRHGDLYPERERSKVIDKPNYKSNVASIGLPFGVRVKRLLFDQYKDLYIVSPDSSPNSSPENSAHTTPSNTWSHHANGDATGGAQPAQTP